MPVTIAVFINPGHTRRIRSESSSTNWGDLINNRGTEYNELNDKYSRLIVNELMPVVDKDYNISKDPDDRALAGASSRERFARSRWRGIGRTSSTKSSAPIGRLTNIRGGHVYPDLILQSDRKPISHFPAGRGLTITVAVATMATTTPNAIGMRRT